MPYEELLVPETGSRVEDDLGLTVEINGTGLTIADACRVSHGLAAVKMTSDSAVEKGVLDSRAVLEEALDAGEVIYGVNTGFGGMANVIMSREDQNEVQNNMLWVHKAGVGKKLPAADVRAAMLLRANSHLRGASAIRLELIRRIEIFLNANITPIVPELGSIGASGDLVPLCYIAGCVTGHDANFMVECDGVEMPAKSALQRLGLEPLPLLPKESLAMLNGTSMMTGIAMNCVKDAQDLLTLALYIHALMYQGLNGNTLPLHPFIHQSKPHAGQIAVAEKMTKLLEGSSLVRQSQGGSDRNAAQGLVQDRYSLRCIPQYLGPIVDGLSEIARQIEVEMNSTTDNPLVDPESRGIYYGGNFLGEYVGVTMDRLRYLLGLAAKHMDVQIGMLMEPHFSNGLPPCLIGNGERRINMGLKALQIAGNSIMPLIQFLGNSLADRYPTHAEQHNQNINSQGFGSANLARQSIDLFRQYMSISLLFAVQSVDQRAHAMYGSYSAGKFLSSRTLPLYEAFREIASRPANENRPLLWNDYEQTLDTMVAKVTEDLKDPLSSILAAANEVAVF
jgi:phenylalanine ammonia-lyase